MKRDHYSRSARNAFSGLDLNRKPVLPGNPTSWEEFLALNNSSFVAVRGDEILFDPAGTDPLLLDARMLGGCDHAFLQPMLLGDDGQTTFFALNVDRMPASLAQCLAGLGTFARLRQHVATMSGKIASLLGYACFAAGWQSQTRFCSLCGHPTVSKPSSLAQCCTNPSCAAEHFPRINPAMIVLVHHPEKDMCLLGRQSSWKPRVYSALAGYVEPGESAEDAVLREVMEETGIRVRDIRYHSSQPWPFSSSLMLGFHALAENLDIHLDDRELEDARWFPRQEIPGLLEKGDLALPSTETIARHLFDAWIQGDLGD